MIGDKELVSVCVPVFNGEKYLTEAIESIITQTYQNLEIIFIDDHSTDGSAEIIQSFAKTDKRIKYFSNPQNLGLVANWNACLEKVTGKWIKFHFQDDLMDDDAIEKILTLAHQSGKQIVLCDRVYFGEGHEKGKRAHEKDRQLKDYIPENQEVFTKEETVTIFNTNLLRNNFFGEPIAGMISKTILDKYGVFDTKMHQIVDLEFWFRIASNEGIAFLRSPLVKFRMHDESQTSRNEKGELEVSAAMCDRFYLVNKLFSDPTYRQYQKLSATKYPLKKLKRRFYSRLVIKAGFLYTKNLFHPSERKHLSWGVIFVGLTKDFRIFLAQNNIPFFK